MPQVFISYSSNDVDIAEKIEFLLTEAGYDVWRDKRMIEADWSQDIAKGLSISDLICLIWTKNAEASQWVKNEWLTARALGKLIIPIILPDAPDLPVPISTLQGVKMDTRVSESSKLIHRLKSLKSFYHNYNYTVLAPENAFNIPFNPNPEFVGREQDLVDLYRKMIGNLKKMGVNLICLVGMAGIGKTQLAVEFGYRFSYAFQDGVYWIQGTNPSNWTREIVQITRNIAGAELRSEEPDMAITDIDYIVAFKNYCTKHPNILLIIDNVDDPSYLNRDDILIDKAREYQIHYAFSWVQYSLYLP